MKTNPILTILLSGLISSFSMAQTVNYIQKANITAPSSPYSNSQIFDNGTTVGVGTSSVNSNAKLQVNGNLFSGSHLCFNSSTLSGTGVINWGSSGGGDLIFRKLTGTLGDVNSFSTVMTMLANGNVGIGVLSPVAKLHVSGTTIIGPQRITSGPHTDFKLSVDGKIVSKEVIVTASGWADFVFDPSYKLPSLKEVDAYIKQNKHLPNIPTTAEVENDGVAISEMTTKLLQKVEELTLYVIDQQQKMEALQKELEELKEKK